MQIKNCQPILGLTKYCKPITGFKSLTCKLFLGRNTTTYNSAFPPALLRQVNRTGRKTHHILNVSAKY